MAGGVHHVRVRPCVRAPSAAPPRRELGVSSFGMVAIAGGSRQGVVLTVGRRGVISRRGETRCASEEGFGWEHAKGLECPLSSGLTAPVAGSAHGVGMGRAG